MRLTPTGVNTGRSPSRHLLPSDSGTGGKKKTLPARDAKMAKLLKQKEQQLEQYLRSRHCRPLLKLFKLVSTDAFQVQFGDRQD